MRCYGMWWLRHMRADRVVHRMVVVQRRWLWSLRTAHALLLLILLPTTFRRIGRSHDSIRSGLVCWVVEQCADVVHEQRVKQLSDLFLVREIQCTFERDPAAASAPSPSGTEHASYQTPLRCIGPILTTCRIFSLFKMPSRRPRVIPATLRSFVPLIMWLSVNQSVSCFPRVMTSVAGKKQRTFPPGDTDTFRLNLKTEAALVFPQRRSHPRLHPGWSDLTGSVECLLRVTLPVSTWAGNKAVRWWSTCRYCCRRSGQQRLANTTATSLPGKGNSWAGT